MSMIQKDGRSALLVACLKGYLEIVKLLVENKANVLLKNKVDSVVVSDVRRREVMHSVTRPTRTIMRLSSISWRTALIPTTRITLLY